MHESSLLEIFKYPLFTWAPYYCALPEMINFYNQFTCEIVFFFGEIGGKHIGKIKLQQIHPMQRKRKNLGLLGACYIISLDCDNYISKCVEHLTQLGFTYLFSCFLNYVICLLIIHFGWCLNLRVQKGLRYVLWICNNVSMDYVEANWSSCSSVLQVPFFWNMVSACNTSRGKGYTTEKLQELSGWCLHPFWWYKEMEDLAKYMMT
jgi:hypothetical protein